MREFDATWVIGGPQGSGINVGAELYAKALARGGLHVFANIEYHSNIMGKHSYYRVRAANREVRSHVDGCHILAALDKETLFGDAYKMEFPTHRGHVHEVAEDGAIIFDADIEGAAERIERDDVILVALPYLDLLKRTLAEVGREAEFKRFEIMKNTLAVGATLALMDYDYELVAEGIRENFTGPKAKIGELNVIALKVAYDHVRSAHGDDFPFDLKAQQERPDRLFIRGTNATAIGKIKGGLTFQTYYPISPATDESAYLESIMKDYNYVVIQAEDEISCINMAVGAAHMGVRAATSTAGPGFSLMMEGIGFASITEAPGPVVFLYQRGGPSTGLPTRHEQGDLRLALQPGHGDFTHLVVAPGDVHECFYDAFESLNWAERYQMPVIVLLDKHLATSYITVPAPSMEGLRCDRGEIYRPADPSRDAYLRYQPTETGVTPRAIPGTKGAIFWATTDEHDPRGHISEGVEQRLAQVQKRFRKLDLAAREIPTERKLALFGSEKADVTIVSWGSTKGAILDALPLLEKEGVKANFLQIRLMRPFPAAEVEEILARSQTLVGVEGNYSGQLCSLIREQTGIKVHHRLLKYDGRPFSLNEIVDGVKALLSQEEERLAVFHT